VSSLRCKEEEDRREVTLALLNGVELAQTRSLVKSTLMEDGDQGVI
jgi:hypothetical protein